MSSPEFQTLFAANFEFCPWLDYNVGQGLAALAACGLGDETTVIHTSDHGDNVGALWGKSVLHKESVTAPLIMAGPDIEPGSCVTPVDLLDLSLTIADHFSTRINGAGEPLLEIASRPESMSGSFLASNTQRGRCQGHSC